MRNRILLMGLLAVSLGVFAFASAADAAGATTWKGSANQTLYNYCTGEYVSGTWSWHGVRNYTVDSNGGRHYTFRYHRQFQGTGVTSGKKYTGKYSSTSSYNRNTGAYNRTSTREFVLRGNGKRQTYSRKSKVTVNANGDLVVSDYDYTPSSCS